MKAPILALLLIFISSCALTTPGKLADMQMEIAREAKRADDCENAVRTAPVIEIKEPIKITSDVVVKSEPIVITGDSLDYRYFTQYHYFDLEGARLAFTMRFEGEFTNNIKYEIEVDTLGSYLPVTIRTKEIPIRDDRAEQLLMEQINTAEAKQMKYGVYGLIIGLILALIFFGVRKL